MAPVLAVTRGVLGRGEQQPVAIVGGAVLVVVQQAGAELLVVRVVARLGRPHRQGLDEGRAVGARAQVGRGPVHRLERPQAVERRVEPLQDLGRGEGVRSLGRDHLHRMVAGRVLLVVRGAVHEGAGHEEELETVRVREGVEEPAHRVAVLVAVLGHRVAVGIAGLHDELGGRELDGVDDLAVAARGLEQADDEVDPARLLAAQQRLLQRE